ncbi:MAG: O-methyltransferase [Bacteroidales bacterium]
MDDFDLKTDSKMYAYVEKHTALVKESLCQLERDTHVNVLGSRMISGAYQGKFLELLSQMIQPFSILEVGTYTGYSAICLASGLRLKGKLITLEHNEELKDRILKYVENAGYREKIELRIVEALPHLQSMQEENFDLIFLDADKENYLNYYPLLLNKLRIGGWLLIDNVLWSGKVYESAYKDKITEILRKFNDNIQMDSNVENIMLPFRDGLSLLRRLR